MLIKISTFLKIVIFILKYTYINIDYIYINIGCGSNSVSDINYIISLLLELILKSVRSSLN